VTTPSIKYASCAQYQAPREATDIDWNNNKDSELQSLSMCARYCFEHFLNFKWYNLHSGDQSKFELYPTSGCSMGIQSQVGLPQKPIFWTTLLWSCQDEGRHLPSPRYDFWATSLFRKRKSQSREFAGRAGHEVRVSWHWKRLHTAGPPQTGSPRSPSHVLAWLRRAAPDGKTSPLPEGPDFAGLWQTGRPPNQEGKSTATAADPHLTPDAQQQPSVWLLHLRGSALQSNKSGSRTSHHQSTTPGPGPRPGFALSHTYNGRTHLL
jgi:hypothetical protein